MTAMTLGDRAARERERVDLVKVVNDREYISIRKNALFTHAVLISLT